jgi:hypothetical protein
LVIIIFKNLAKMKFTQIFLIISALTGIILTKKITYEDLTKDDVLECARLLSNSREPDDTKADVIQQLSDANYVDDEMLLKFIKRNLFLRKMQKKAYGTEEDHDLLYMGG